jgi:hypothetical protein
MLGGMRGQVNEGRGVGGYLKRVVGVISPFHLLILRKAKAPAVKC